MLEIKKLIDTSFDWGISFVVKRRLCRNQYDKYIKLVFNQLQIDNAELIELYQRKEFPISEQHEVNVNEKIPVWYCWWQGEEEMPPIIKMCYESIKKNLPYDVCSLYLITLDNYKDFVQFPSYIEEKFAAGIISMTHLSDLLRVTLVSQYGGFFIDSGFYLNEKIDKDFIMQDFFVRRRSSTQCPSYSIAKGRWTGNYFIGKPGDFYFCFLRDALLSYWKKHNILIHYFLIDFLIWIMYENFDKVRNRILAIPESDPCVHELQKIINKKYDEKIFEKLTQETKVFKLTQKIKLEEKNDNDEMTFYGYLLHR